MQKCLECGNYEDDQAKVCSTCGAEMPNAHTDAIKRASVPPNNGQRPLPNQKRNQVGMAPGDGNRQPVRRTAPQGAQQRTSQGTQQGVQRVSPQGAQRVAPQGAVQQGKAPQRASQNGVRPAPNGSLQGQTSTAPQEASHSQGVKRQASQGTQGVQGQAARPQQKQIRTKETTPQNEEVNWGFPEADEEEQGLNVAVEEDTKERKKKEKVPKKPKAEKTKKEKAPKKEKAEKVPISDGDVITVKQWLGIWVAMMVPIYNIITIIRMIKGSKGQTLKNMVISYLIIMLAVLIICVIFGILATLGLASVSVSLS